jgi:hypothetical protein
MKSHRAETGTMKPSGASIRKRGFTKWELLIVVALLGALAALLLPVLAIRKAKAKRISCVCNLKQIGLALRMWSNECGEKFPWQVTTNRGGSSEWIGANDAYRHFRVVSNELSSPKVLVCSSDSARSRAARWEDVTSNRRLSYFVGLDADETRPQTILSGDRNLATNGRPANALLRLTAAVPVEWTEEIHQHQGNIGLGDGSVQQLTPAGMNKQIEAAMASETNRTAIRLLIP